MASILVPQKKQNPVGGLLPMAGQIVGSYFGPVGGMVGGMIGQQVSGSMNKPGPGAIEAPESDLESTSPIDRRKEKLDEDPYEAVRKARLALEQAPKELQDAYRDTLDQAVKMGRPQSQMQGDY